MKNIYWIDLFCGAGGTTTGIHLANAKAKVIACVNHDSEAIKCHYANHPDCLHLTEDVRDFKVVLKLKELVQQLRKKDPSCIINIWASLECTHFSKAKGGLSRDADSRTLADHLYKYIEQLDPDYIYIEKVREFLSWGPLNKEGKPIKHLKGTDYNRWRDAVKFYGYNYEYQLLNSADFGAYTSRERYFGVFGRIGMPIRFPKKSHSKKEKKGLKKWKPVKDVLNLDNEGRTIFGLTLRKKKYSEKTLARIYAGLKKFAKEGLFIQKYYSGKPDNKVRSANEPAGTVTTIPHEGIVKPVFLTSYYGTTKPKHKLITAQWMFDTQYSNVGKSINQPSPTLIAKMNKKPQYLASAIPGGFNNSMCFKEDSLIILKIKLFMRQHKISDIKIRMLEIDELKAIQGFPEDFQLIGSKTNQLKFIGNSVVPLMAQRLIESNSTALMA